VRFVRGFSGVYIRGGETKLESGEREVGECFHRQKLQKFARNSKVAKVLCFHRLVASVNVWHETNMIIFFASLQHFYYVFIIGRKNL
jgi:hypothetical protein